MNVAVIIERTAWCERAALAESTEVGERAGCSESTTLRERAVDTERTGTVERAAANERTEIEERFYQPKGDKHMDKTIDEPHADTINLEVIIGKLDKDLRAAAKAIGRDEARFLVDTYYQLQKDRIRSGLRVRAAEEHTAATVLSWVESQSFLLEKRVATMLDLWSAAHPMGPWLRSVHGVGPVISAGLLANLDIEKAPTVGHFWAISGLDPSKSWNKGEKRPWNASLKRLCFLIGESFMKSGGSDKSFYGPIYKQRKDYEWTKNLRGDYAEQARFTLATKKFVDKSRITKTGSEGDSERQEIVGAKKWYEGAYNAADLSVSPPKGIKPIVREDGLLIGKPGVQMLPPGRIQLRAKRYAVKLFLAHFHNKWYEIHFGCPAPLPYPIAHLGHVHFIEAAQ